MNHRHSLVIHSLLDQIRQHTRLPRKSRSDKRHTQRQVKLQRIQFFLDLAEWRTTRNRAHLRSGRTLTFGQPVHAIIHNHRSDVQVTCRLRSDVLAADAQEVAVSGHHHHIQLGPRHLHAHRHRKRSPVDSVEPVGLLSLQQMNQIAAAANAGNNHVVFYWPASFFQPVDHAELQRAAYSKVTTAGAPLEVVLRVLFAHTRATSFTGEIISLMRDTRSLTLKGSPVYWVIASAFTPCERRMPAHCPW